MAQMPMKAPGAAIMINAKPAPAGAQKIQTVRRKFLEQQTSR